MRKPKLVFVKVHGWDNGQKEREWKEGSKRKEGEMTERDIHPWKILFQPPQPKFQADEEEGFVFSTGKKCYRELRKQPITDPV